MRLFTRLCIGCLISILIAETVLVVGVSSLSPRLFSADLGAIPLISAQDRQTLLEQLAADQRRSLLVSLFISLPLATLFAGGVAYREAHRIARSTRILTLGAQAVAQGRYAKEIKFEEQGELSELAHHFNQMADALRRSDQDRTELVGTVAHELRTPLAALQGYGEALADGVMPAETASRGITREVRALRRIADDMLLVTRFEVGRFDIQLSLQAAGELLEDAEDHFAQAFELRGIAFEVLLPSLLPPVWADRERTGQVFSNLLANALRYTPEGGKVVLGASVNGASQVRFYVRDTGPGIAAEHQARVFDRFYRVDEARSRNRGGLGVGLTISKHLVEAMGGWIWLESAPGQGATFGFTLLTAAALAEA